MSDLNRGNLDLARVLNTKPGKQIVAENEEGELVELGEDPKIYVGDRNE